MRLLLDEMLPPSVAGVLNEHGHDAVSAQGAGLLGAPDQDVFDLAVRDGRTIVTENVADFALLLQRSMSRDEPCVPVVFVRRSDFPAKGALATHLAAHLHAWATQNPDPYIGPHWPPVASKRRL